VLFQLFTKAVDNFVGKSLLTGWKPPFHAVFNKLHKTDAQKITFKINGLKTSRRMYIPNMDINYSIPGQPSLCA
jgi:hypothetical protein